LGQCEFDFSESTPLQTSTDIGTQQPNAATQSFKIHVGKVKMKTQYPNIRTDNSYLVLADGYDQNRSSVQIYDDSLDLETIASLGREALTNITSQAITDLINEGISQLVEKKPVIHLLESICGVSPEKWTEELSIWIKTSQSFQQRNWLNCWKTYWPGFDAWGIGAILLSILDVQLRFPTFKNSEQWKTKGPLILLILSNLCRGHPAYRIDAAEALSAYTNKTHPLIANKSTDVVVSDVSDNTDAPLSGYEWIQQKQAVRKNVSS
jgi:hypothetical protein